MACSLTEVSKRELRGIPPIIISFPSNASYKEVIQKGVEKFFPDDKDFMDMFCLADSSGVPFEIEDTELWCLSEFVHQSGLPPSKLRLYNIMNLEEVYMSLCKHVV